MKAQSLRLERKLLTDYTVIFMDLTGQYILEDLLSQMIFWIYYRYLASVYDQHKDLLDGQARREVQSFIQSDAELSTFAKVHVPMT